MSRRNEGDDVQFYLDNEAQIAATREAVARRAREVLQYEWPAYLAASPPDDGRTWVTENEGMPWGVVLPREWARGREQGFDLHFEHFPTARALERGQLRLEVHLEDGVSGGADFGAGSRYSELRERILERLGAFEESLRTDGRWPSGEPGSDRTLWAGEYRFPAGDSRAYSETLRGALEEYSEFVGVVTDVVYEELDGES
jgi:hypothetical protein